MSIKKTMLAALTAIGVTVAVAMAALPASASPSAKAAPASTTSTQTVYALAVNRTHPAQYWFAHATDPNSDNMLRGQSAQNDSEVIAQAATLKACAGAGVAIQDCDNVVWVQNGYVALSVDSATSSWGDAWNSGEKAAEKAAGTYCVNHGGTAAVCDAHEYAQGSNAGGSASAGYSWGYFYENSDPNAILWAMNQLGTDGTCGSGNCLGECLIFVQLTYGETSGAWANGYGGSAASALTYLEGKDKGYPTDYIYSAVPGPDDSGDLVWFNPSNDNENLGHVGIYLGNDQYISVADWGVSINSISAWSATSASYAGYSTPPAAWPGR